MKEKSAEYFTEDVAKKLLDASPLEFDRETNTIWNYLERHIAKALHTARQEGKDEWFKIGWEHAVYDMAEKIEVEQIDKARKEGVLEGRREQRGIDAEIARELEFPTGFYQVQEAIAKAIENSKI